jgi:hypothetical protein
MEPGELRSIYYFDQDSGGTWKYYGLLRIGGGGGFLRGMIPQGSYINRMVPFDRHFAGVPTGQAPAARK